jgi:GNAT superfamily N-acetyltransferase
MADIRIVPKAEAASWVHSLHSAKPSMALGLLLAGDRWLCVDEVALATVDGEIVGIATIAPEGEMRDGEPTIVAIYVLHEHRASGIGYELLEATVDYMSSKGFTPIRVDVMNSKVSRMIDRLPADKRQKLSVVDQSMGGAMDAMLEM